MHTQDLKDGRYFVFNSAKAASDFADLFGEGTVVVIKVSGTQYEYKYEVKF
jgi:hypothetical protein